MKLRIKGNSLRLRLLRGEVEQFSKTGRVVETIQFGTLPSECLCYVLEAAADEREINANFGDNRITVVIPEEIARNWIETELVTLQAEQLIENDSADNILKILIEKDFVCLDRKDDPDNSDAFPHPTGKCAG
jgi:hypothetical protein